MKEIKDIDVSTVNPKMKIDKSTRHKLFNTVKNESQVIIHCLFTGTIWIDRIRIWKSTFLYAKGSNHKSKLVHAENITLYPEWMSVEIGQTVEFTLIFTGLPKFCKQFDLIENIPVLDESFELSFGVKNIERNNSDVYLIDMTWDNIKGIR